MDRGGLQGSRLPALDCPLAAQNVKTSDFGLFLPRSEVQV
jgi:hypothetical protein